jgi:hypothetical protein
MSFQETVNSIVDWVDPNFFFSKNLKWNDTAIVGVLGDYALNYIAGDILEIGCGISSIYLTALSKKYNREIYYCDSDKDKVDRMKAVKGCFYEKGHIYTCPSDNMFEKNELTPLSFAFIDGYHSYEQSKKDFWNVEKYIVLNGHILMHDSYPPLENWQGRGSCGEVWKFRQEIEQDKRFDCFTFVGAFNGSATYIASTLIRKKPINRPYYQE